MSVVTGLARWYFTPRSWETTAFYETVGARAFKRVIIALGRGIVGKRKIVAPNHYFLWDDSLQGLEKLEHAGRVVEVLHLFWLLVTGPMAVTYILDSRAGLSVLMGLLAVLNAYCVLLQRFNRVRLLCVQERMRSLAPCRRAKRNSGALDRFKNE